MIWFLLLIWRKYWVWELNDPIYQQFCPLRDKIEITKIKWTTLWYNSDKTWGGRALVTLSEEDPCPWFWYMVTVDLRELNFKWAADLVTRVTPKELKSPVFSMFTWSPWSAQWQGGLGAGVHQVSERERDGHPGQARHPQLPRGRGGQQDRVLDPAPGHAPPHCGQVCSVML